MELRMKLDQILDFLPSVFEELWQAKKIFCFFLFLRCDN